MEYVAVAVGGMCGALGRYSIAQLFLTFGLRGFLATAFVNILGSFLIGLLFMLSQKWQVTSFTTWLKPFLMIGLLGSFTTFSAFSLDAIQNYTVNQQWTWVVLYVMYSVLLSLLACIVGMKLASIF